MCKMFSYKHNVLFEKNVGVAYCPWFLELHMQWVLHIQIRRKQSKKGANLRYRQEDPKVEP